MASSSSAAPVPLVMQLIVDHSLAKEWTKGPLMAQAAHASIAAIQISSNTQETQAYVAPDNLAAMHKIVLATPANLSLSDIAKRIDEASAQDSTLPSYFLWVEQPENIPTCLAVAPNRKPPALKKILNKCSLLRD